MFEISPGLALWCTVPGEELLYVLSLIGPLLIGSVLGGISVVAMKEMYYLYKVHGAWFQFSIYYEKRQCLCLSMPQGYHKFRA